MDTMRRLFRKTVKQLQQPLLIVLFCFFATAKSLSWWQEVQQHHHHTSHTADIERDPCHQAIYHSNGVRACDHKAHWIADTPGPENDAVAPDAFFAEVITGCFSAGGKPSGSSRVATNTHYFRAVSSRAPPVL